MCRIDETWIGWEVLVRAPVDNCAFPRYAETALVLKDVVRSSVAPRFDVALFDMELNGHPRLLMAMLDELREP